MKITEQERNATTIIEANAPAGQNPFKYKRKLIADGNLQWLMSCGYLDGDYNFTKKAEQDEIVKAKVVNNTSEFGRGVKGQVMYVPKSAGSDGRTKADFQF